VLCLLCAQKRIDIPPSPFSFSEHVRQSVSRHISSSISQSIWFPKIFFLQICVCLSYPLSCHGWGLRISPLVCLFPRSLTPDLPHSPPTPRFPPTATHLRAASPLSPPRRGLPAWRAQGRPSGAWLLSWRTQRPYGLCCCDRTGNMWTCLAHSRLPVSVLCLTRRPSALHRKTL